MISTLSFCQACGRDRFSVIRHPVFPPSRQACRSPDQAGPKTGMHGRRAGTKKKRRTGQRRRTAGIPKPGPWADAPGIKRVRPAVCRFPSGMIQKPQTETGGGRAAAIADLFGPSGSGFATKAGNDPGRLQGARGGACRQRRSGPAGPLSSPSGRGCPRNAGGAFKMQAVRMRAQKAGGGNPAG